MIGPDDFPQQAKGADRTGTVEPRFLCRTPDVTRSDERGTVIVEYVILLSVVAVGLSLAAAALGVPLLRMYLTQQTWILLPFP
jgi:hypothetical protein